MKKKRTSEEVAIATIKAFFAKSRVKSFDLDEIGGNFTLDEGGLFDTKVNTIDEQGIGIDSISGFRGFEALDLSDLRYIVGYVLPQLKESEPELYKQQIIDKVVVEIDRDIAMGDTEALDEMLKFVPIENLIAFLPEGIKIKK